MNLCSLQLLHNYIINEINTNISDIITSKSNLKCKAIKPNGKRCTNKKSKDKEICKIHEKCKNLKLIKDRQNYSCILYHNHLPSESIVNGCPRCMLIK